MPPDSDQFLFPGDDVSFPQDGPTSGSIARAGPDTFNLPAIGTYQVMFNVGVFDRGQLILTLNGTPLPYTGVETSSFPISQLVGTFLVTTTVTDSSLSVRNPSDSGIEVNVASFDGGNAPVSAHLVITQIR